MGKVRIKHWPKIETPRSAEVERTPPFKVDLSTLDLNHLPTDVTQLHAFVNDLAKAAEDTLDPVFCANEVEPAFLESLTQILKK